MTTIDLTPSWESLLPVLLAVLTDGNADGRAMARAELLRMAQAADLYNLELDRRVQSARRLLES